MNTHIFQRKGLSAKLIAILATAVLVASVLAVNLGASLAAPAAIDVALECESGIPAANHIEVGQTKSLGTSYLFEAHSTEPAKAAVIYTQGSGLDNLKTTGLGAGVASVSFGTVRGVLSTVRYQIVDSNNISAYTIRDGGEVYFTAPGAEKTSPVKVTAGRFDRIAWQSMNTGVASVDENGRITANGKGAAIIVGSFIDKWGVPRDLHILAGVGVKLSDSDLGNLLELIEKGEAILKNDPDGYTTDSLHDLEDAVAGGKDVVNSVEPGDREVNDAIKELEDAIAGMDKRPQRPDDVIGPDKDGNYYKPLGDPENVYEAVDENGNSKQPPEYVYNPGGDPVGKPDQNRPAYPDGGFYYVEDPEGSNIYKPVTGDGSIKDKPAKWGGPDGMLGGGDDECVKKFGDDYWKHLGQNVWQKIDKNKPTQKVPTLIGGGPDENPATDPVTPIYEHDGIFYVGPLPPGTNNGFYYGDKQQGGDGKVNSSQGAMHPTDEKYYLVNGQMVPESGLTAIPGLEDTKIGDSITIDGTDWIKAKTDSSGKYALLILDDLIGPMQYDNNSGYGGEYGSADIRAHVEAWYKALNAPTIKKYAHSAMIGTDDYETWPYAGTGEGTGIYVFLPKRSDLANLDASRLDMGKDYWTATKTKAGDFIGYQVTVADGGKWSQKGVTQTIYARPAVWVKMK